MYLSSDFSAFELLQLSKELVVRSSTVRFCPSSHPSFSFSILNISFMFSSPFLSQHETRSRSYRTRSSSLSRNLPFSFDASPSQSDLVPSLLALFQVAHPADGAWKSIQSLWARKEVSLSRTTRLEDGQLAFQQSTTSERRNLLATFAEVDKHTAERKKALEEKARLILEGKIKKAEGDDEDDDDRRTPGLTLTDEEESESETEGEKTPRDGKGTVKMERKKDLSEGDVKLLRQLAMAEKKGYERAKAEQEAAAKKGGE